MCSKEEIVSKLIHSKFTLVSCQEARSLLCRGQNFMLVATDQLDSSDSHLQVSSHFVRLFSEPSSPEQCSHNAVVLVEALRYVGLDYDCQVRKGEHLQ